MSYRPPKARKRSRLSNGLTTQMHCFLITMRVTGRRILDRCWSLLQMNNNSNRPINNLRSSMGWSTGSVVKEGASSSKMARWCLQALWKTRPRHQSCRPTDISSLQVTSTIAIESSKRPLSQIISNNKCIYRTSKITGNSLMARGIIEIWKTRLFVMTRRWLRTMKIMFGIRLSLMALMQLPHPEVSWSLWQKIAF